MDIKGGVSLPEASAPNPLATWVQTPAVRMPDVLAISDERIITNNPFVSVTGICPGNLEIQYNNGTYSAPGGWVQFYPKTNLIQGHVALDSVNILGTPAGAAACLYIVNGNLQNALILENSNFTHVKTSSGRWFGVDEYSGFWPFQNPAPSFMCPTQASSASCVFETVAP
jgi:hypothetical protein